MMKYLFLSLLISLMCILCIGNAFSGIPDDADLLLWIGEGSGNKAVDGTGNGNDGTFGGNAKWVAGQGKFAAGIALRGAESFLEVPNTITEAGSLLFWFRPDWAGGDGEDYRIFDASFGPIYFFVGQGSAHPDITPAEFGFYFEAADDGDWQDVEFDPKGVIKKEAWFHAAITWDFGGEAPFIYIDGEELATSRKITGGFPNLHEKPRFGWETVQYIAMNNGAEGIIDEISFWKRVLDANEIREMMDVSLDVEPIGKLAVTWGAMKVVQ